MQVVKSLFDELNPQLEEARKLEQEKNRMFAHRFNVLDYLRTDEFYYFGRDALEIPDEVRPKVPRDPTRYGVLSSQAQAERFIEFIRKNYNLGWHGFPHHWDEDSKTGCGTCG